MYLLLILIAIVLILIYRKVVVLASNSNKITKVLTEDNGDYDWKNDAYEEVGEDIFLN